MALFQQEKQQRKLINERKERGICEQRYNEL